MKKLKGIKGITLIALIITIIILLILAGISIATLTGDNGILNKASVAKEKEIKAEMKEQLILAMYNLQTEKLGKATLQDVTQDWLEREISAEYHVTVKDETVINEKKVTMQKDGITGQFIIDEKLNITEINVEETIAFSYEIGKRVGSKVPVTIYIQDKKYGIDKIELENEEDKIYEKNKEKITINYEAEIGQNYRIKITTGNAKTKEETIVLEKYYHTITKTLGAGIQIDNQTTKTAYNEPYKAKITTESDYILETLDVKMGETVVNVEKSTGVIEIANVTDDITIIATAKEIKPLEIELVESSKNTGEVKFENGEYTLSGNAVLESKEPLPLLENFTVSIEVKNLRRYYDETLPTTDTSCSSLIIGVGDVTSGRYTESRCLGITDGQILNSLYVFSGTGKYSTISKDLLNQEWNKLDITYDGTICKVFINGEQSLTLSTAKFFSTKLYVGGWSNAPEIESIKFGFANGTYRNIKVYDEALSPNNL